MAQGRAFIHRKLHLFTQTVLFGTASLIFLSSTSAFARDLCSDYANYIPRPDWYDDLCRNGLGNFHSSMGAAFSTFADAFNLNPSSIPTDILPVGVELISSRSSNASLPGKTSFAFIKGMDDYGIGVSTDSDDTIYSNRSTHSTSQFSSGTFVQSVAPGSLVPTISIGSSLSLKKFLKIRAMSMAELPKLGLLARYNSDLGNWSPGVGTSMDFGLFNAGMSVVREQRTQLPNSVTFPGTTVFSLNGGIHFQSIRAELVRIQNVSDYYSNVVTIATAAAKIGSFSFSGALRNSDAVIIGNYEVASTSRIYHFGIQYLMSPHFALSYLYNYVPGYQSFSLQMIF